MNQLQEKMDELFRPALVFAQGTHFTNRLGRCQFRLPD
jgi:hypothetical protein